MDSTTILGYARFPKTNRVIIGHFQYGHHLDDGSPYVIILKVSDVLELPDFLLDIIPEQMIKLSGSASGYLVLDSFDGEIIYNQQ